MADYYKRLIFSEGDSAQEFKLAVNLSGDGAPDEATAADVGMLYLDTSSEDGDLYKCIAVTVTESGTTYAWKKLGDSAIYVLKEGETVNDAPANAVIVINPYDDTGENADERYDAILATVPNKASVDGSTLKMQRKTTAEDGTETTSDLFDVELPASESGGTDISLGVTGAAVGQIAKITAVDDNGVPTAWEAVDMESGGSSTESGGWTKLGDITVSETIEFIPLSFTGGIVTIDTNSKGYENLSSKMNCVVHPINVTTKVTPGVGFLQPVDFEAGTFEFYNRDGVIQSSAAYDPATYKISIMNVGSVVMENIEPYSRYKLRMTTPVISVHGLRQYFSCSISALQMMASVSANMSSGAIFESELFKYPYDENYCYIRYRMAWGKIYGGNSTDEMQGFVMNNAGGAATQPPSSGEVSFNVVHMIFVNGTRFELWGTNDD